MSRLEIKSPIDRFFFKLINTPKPNRKKATDGEIFNYVLKFYSGVCFFNLGKKYLVFLSWLTQYYPFSLLFTWRLFHAKNAELRGIVDSIEENADKLKIPITYRGWNVESQIMAILYFKIYRKIENVDEAQRKLEKVLQEIYSTIYVSNEGKYFKVLVPLTLINSQ